MTVNSDRLSYLCFGVGAIGSYIGGSLLLAGNEVTFVDRPEVKSQVADCGIKMSLDGHEYQSKVTAIFTSPIEALMARSYDIAILAIKSFDTAGLMDELKSISDHVPSILCLQNGVENELMLAKGFGTHKVIAGTVTTAIERRGAGNIQVQRLRGLGVADGHKLSLPLVNCLNRAGLKAQLYAHPLGMKWSKLLTNLLANASSAILDMPPSEIFAHPGLFCMEAEQLREAMRVMAAQNIPVMDLPGTPVRLLSWMIKYLPMRISQPFLAASLGKGRGQKMPSLHIDYHGRRGKSEVDFLNGAVVRAGKRSGVLTPINEKLNTILMDLNSFPYRKNEFARHPEKLLASIY
jgi:2-dehydropantoate 2-reductase